MRIVDQLALTLLPNLERFASEMSDEFPGIRTRAFVQETSANAAWQRFEVYVESNFSERSRRQADDIALEITLDLEQDPPRFRNADVCWGHPSGEIEAMLAIDGLPYSAESLATVRDGLPTLFEAMRNALARGHPVGPNLFPQ